MKKGKRILAMLGVIILIGMYLATIITAIIDTSGTMNMVFASLIVTIIIPVFLWVYALIYRLVKGNQDDESGK